MKTVQVWGGPDDGADVSMMSDAVVLEISVVQPAPPAPDGRPAPPSRRRYYLPLWTHPVTGKIYALWHEKREA